LIRSTGPAPPPMSPRRPEGTDPVYETGARMLAVAGAGHAHEAHDSAPDAIASTLIASTLIASALVASMLIASTLISAG
jgi:hypothetical protein